jgi:translation initiation factor 3 subunit H
VCIVYDPSRSSQGVLALKALKLTDSFMDLYRNNGLTGEKYDLFSVAQYCTSLYKWFLYNDCYAVAG